MKPNIYLLLILMMVAYHVGFAQVNFSVGPEIGINSSGRFNKYGYVINPRNEPVTITNKPVISPVFGIWTQAGYRKHFFTTFGVQYLWVGNKYHYHRDGNDYMTKKNYVSEEWENQTFQKISAPISIGYKFKIGKLKPGIFLGMKQEYYTSGKYLYRSVYTEDNNPNDIIRLYEYNPFDKTQFMTTAQRWNTGYFAGISFDIKDKLMLNLSYTLNQYVMYGNSFGGEFNGYSFYGDDISLIIKYNLRSAKINLQKHFPTKPYMQFLILPTYFYILHSIS